MILTADGRGPDQQPRDRRRHQRSRSPWWRPAALHADVVGHDPTADVALLQMRNASGLQAADR